MVVVADAQAARNGAIGQNRSNVDAGTARKIMAPHLPFVTAQIAIATLVGRDFALQPRLLDELHHVDKLLVRQFQIRLIGGAAKGKNGE